MMKLVVVLILGLVLVVESESVGQWLDVNDIDYYRYRDGCDFNGRDIECHWCDIPDEFDCAKRCLGNIYCTHFTYRNDHACCLKRSSADFSEIENPGHVCGYIPGRFAPFWPQERSN